MKKYINKFIGDKKIKVVKIDDKKKTYLGKNVCYVLFIDNSVQYIPAELLDSIVTKKPIDATELQDKRTKPVVEKMLGIMLEADLPTLDINAVAQQIQSSLSHSIDLANNKLWGKTKYDTTLMDVQRVLEKK